MIFQNIAERPLNIASVPNNFKSFIKQIYQKEWMQNINKKRVKIITSEQKEAKRRKSNLHLKKKNRLNLNDQEKLLSF